jgi:hypothetical protein
LTGDFKQQSGVVWYHSPLDITTSFTLDVAMYFGTNNGVKGSSISPGADGMAFVLQNQGPNALGGQGGGMGWTGCSTIYWS